MRALDYNVLTRLYPAGTAQPIDPVLLATSGSSTQASDGNATATLLPSMREQIAQALQAAELVEEHPLCAAVKKAEIGKASATAVDFILARLQQQDLHDGSF